MWWTGNYTEIEMTKKQAADMSRPGRDATDIVKLYSKYPKIKRQLMRLHPEKIKMELKEYGAWDEDELNDYDENELRFLWIAAGDIVDRNEF